MRICFTSDLHGRATLFDQLEELLRAERPDLLILGGDLMDDGLLEDPIATQVAYVEHDFMPRVQDWKTAAPRMIVACLAGNHEWYCTRDALQAHHDAGRIVLLNGRDPWQHAGVSFVGYPCTPPTPHTVKDFERLDLPDDPLPELGGVIWDAARRRSRHVQPAEHFGRAPTMSQELAQLPSAPAPWILVAHAPPHDTKLDRLPTLSYPIGSRAVRRFIEERQPLCSLHGHVHESPRTSGSYFDRLGRTLCINPGQSFERLYAVLFDVERPAETLRHTVFT